MNRLIQDGGPHEAFGNLAQGNDGGFIIFPFNQRLHTIGELPGTLGCDQHQLKTIINLVETIFYSNACHVTLRKT